MSTAGREYEAVRDWMIDDIIHRLRPFARETAITFTFGDKSKLVVCSLVRPNGDEVITRIKHHAKTPARPTKPKLASLDDIERGFLERSGE